MQLLMPCLHRLHRLFLPLIVSPFQEQEVNLEFFHQLTFKCKLYLANICDHTCNSYNRIYYELLFVMVVSDIEEEARASIGRVKPSR